MRYAVIGSGSSANSYIFEAGESLYVIDNGFSLKEFKRRVKELGFEYTRIKGVFLTHIHSDHLKGVGPLSRDLEIPVYTHLETEGNFYIHKGLEPDQHYKFGELDIMPFNLSHDAPNAIGYYFKIGETRSTLITDTGVITSQMFQLAKRSDILFLESNYNDDMLKNGSYPYYLKRRISSDMGHLSNNAAITFLNDLWDSEASIKMVYLCHLSKNNNSVEAVENDFKENYTGEFRYRICNREEAVSYLEADMVKLTFNG